MSGNDAEPIFLTIATSPNSTQTMIEVLTLAARQDGWPRYGGALRHLADLLDGRGRGGGKAIDDSERLAEVRALMARGWKRSPALWCVATMIITHFTGAIQS